MLCKCYYMCNYYYPHPNEKDMRIICFGLLFIEKHVPASYRVIQFR
jgi:hypothetical protein